MNALKQRAQAVLNDKSIDVQSRAIIRYALETLRGSCKQFTNSVRGAARLREEIQRIPKGIRRFPERNAEDPEWNPQKKVRITYRRAVIRSKTKYIIFIL
jgi:hypothetical protein